MMDKVTIGDVAVKISEYRDFKISHQDLVDWSRTAMMASSIPPSQVEVVIDLLQDISRSTPITINAALATHEKLFRKFSGSGGELSFGE